MTKSLPYLISIILIIGIYISYVASETIQVAASAIVWMVVSALGILVLSGVGIGLFYLLMLREKYLTAKEHRHKVGREVVTTQDGKVIIRDNDPHSTWRQIHLNPNAYVNGHWENPTDQQLRVYEAFLSRNKAAKQPLLIEGEIIPTTKTIYDILKIGIHFSLIGATNAGKTMLASHIIDYMKIKSYILSPHYHIDKKEGKWSNNATGIQSYDDIEKCLQSVFTEMSYRYDNAITDSEDILLVIDEWPAIVAEKSDCEHYISRISREGRKVGIKLILLSQSDQIGEIGLSVSLRNNFIKIEMIPELTQQNQARIKHWDKSTELITLAGPYIKQMTTEERIIDEWLKIDKSDYETAITEVTKIVYLSYGGAQRNRVKEIVKGLVNENN